MKRRIIAVLLATTGMLAAVFAMPSAASADTNNGHYTLTAQRLYDGSIAAYIPAGYGLGDCTLQTGGYLTLTPPDNTGRMLFTWHGTAQTSRTKDYDQWNQVAHFRDSSNKEVVTTGDLHGSKMSTLDTTYTWDRFQELTVRPITRFSTITKIYTDWSC